MVAGSVAPADVIAIFTPLTLWLLRLSRMTMSPGRSAGAKNWRAYARNISPSVGPSVTIGAINPS